MSTLIDSIRSNLRASRGKWPEIALRSGVPYSTIAKISQQVTANPRVDSVQRLADYFKAHSVVIPADAPAPDASQAK